VGEVVGSLGAAEVGLAGEAAVAVGACRVVSATVVPIPAASTRVPATSSGRMRRMMVPLGWFSPPGWRLTVDVKGSRSRISVDAISAAARIDHRRSSLTTRALLWVANGLVAALMRTACVLKHRQIVSWSLTCQQEAGVPAVATVKCDRGRRPTSPAGWCHLRRPPDPAADEPGRPIALDSGTALPQLHRSPGEPGGQYAGGRHPTPVGVKCGGDGAQTLAMPAVRSAGGHRRSAWRGRRPAPSGRRLAEGTRRRGLGRERPLRRCNRPNRQLGSERPAAAYPW
jgi:hypothetical protein